jgi:hypothetical protein
VPAAIARNGGAKRGQDPRNERQNGQAAVLKTTAIERGFTTPFTQYPVSAPQPELSQYLRQLSILHAAGILTDEEFSAAKGRLVGS